MEIPPIEHATYIAAPPEVVYETLTTDNGWDAWFTDGTTVDARTGGSIRLRWKNFGAGRWTTEDGGPVIEADPPHRFVFQWSPGTQPTTVAFDIEPMGSGTLLRITESGYRQGADDLAACIGCAVGWGEALTLLKFYLEHGVTYAIVPDDAESGR